MPNTTIITRHFTLHQAILGEFGVVLPAGAKVLDFGCGKGAMVEEYAQHGFAGYGCDPRLSDETDTLRQMKAPDYRIPFPDNTFAFVFSDQVMEHVQDHAAASAEIYRVLQPGGISLHLFPSRWKPLESHVLVPFAGVWQNRAWLSLWAYLGVRTSAHRGQSAREISAKNYEYLNTRTNYLSKEELLHAFGKQFGAVTFAEPELLKHTYGGARKLAALAQRIGLIAPLYAAFYSRAIFLRKRD